MQGWRQDFKYFVCARTCGCAREHMLVSTLVRVSDWFFLVLGGGWWVGRGLGRLGNVHLHYLFPFEKISTEGIVDML